MKVVYFLTFYTGRVSVHLYLDRISTILPYVLFVFSQSLQANAEIVPSNRT